MDYTVEEVAKALHAVMCGKNPEHDEPDTTDNLDAKSLVDYMYEDGWRLSRLEPEAAIEGPLQRALGLGETNDRRS